MLDLARSDEYGKAFRRENLRDLKSDPFVGPVIRAMGLSCIVFPSMNPWKLPSIMLLDASPGRSQTPDIAEGVNV
jgi:hypothetical protein